MMICDELMFLIRASGVGRGGLTGLEPPPFCVSSTPTQLDLSIYSALYCMCSYRIAGIFRGYKCLRFSRIEPLPRKFIPTKIYIFIE